MVFYLFSTLNMARQEELESPTPCLGVAPVQWFEVLCSTGKSLKYKGFQRFAHQILLPCDS